MHHLFITTTREGTTQRPSVGAEQQPRLFNAIILPVPALADQIRFLGGGAKDGGHINDWVTGANVLKCIQQFSFTDFQSRMAAV
jgi:hypothetical protein